MTLLKGNNELADRVKNTGRESLKLERSKRLYDLMVEDRQKVGDSKEQRCPVCDETEPHMAKLRRHMFGDHEVDFENLPNPEDTSHRAGADKKSYPWN